jgi:bifunctional UDP-N-acetylglucosamine pyrophosphorylase/glucosamine-1-phosphate N-acetyltransferase
VIEDGAFIGSDTQLVAPVRVGKGAYVAAGSSIVEDVPAGALGIARAKQVNKPGWVSRKKG